MLQREELLQAGWDLAGWLLHTRVCQSSGMRQLLQHGVQLETEIAGTSGVRVSICCMLQTARAFKGIAN